jgi:hypothetical protein
VLAFIRLTLEVAMAWETPTFEEIKMDAEISSYQEDSGGLDG